MFVLALPVAEKILRPIVVYFFLVIGLRLAGKRELAQLNPFDLVVLLTLSNTVQNAIIGDDNSVTGGIIGAATLLLVNYLVVRFLYPPRKAGPARGGRVLRADRERKDSAKTRLTKEVLTRPGTRGRRAQAGIREPRRSGARHLEPSGTISFIAKKPAPEETRHRELLARLDQLRAKSRHCGWGRLLRRHEHVPSSASVQQESGHRDAKPGKARDNSQKPEDTLAREQRERRNHQRDFQKHFAQVEAVCLALRASGLVFELLGLAPRFPPALLCTARLPCDIFRGLSRPAPCP